MDQWSWRERVLSKRERVWEEFIQGRDLASKLYRVLDHKTLVKGGNVGSAENLVNKILGSFSNSLSIINGNKEADHDEIQVKSCVAAADSSSLDAANHADSSSLDAANHDDYHAMIKYEDSSEESCKSTSLAVKAGRGTYKRRKTSLSWSRDTTTLTDDGHAWRKYGQKLILHAKHPRNYYRCTHKFDQACQATKHVQQIQDSPPVFRTTYYDNHTCSRDYLKASELVLNCTSPGESSKLISFDNTNLTNKQEHPFFSSFLSVKKDVIVKEEILSSDDHIKEEISSCDYFVSPDLTAVESSAPMSGVSSTLDQLDQEDVISRMMLESYEFDDEALSYEF